jgi:hypothetical protein
MSGLLFLLVLQYVLEEGPEHLILEFSGFGADLLLFHLLAVEVVDQMLAFYQFAFFVEQTKIVRG